MNYLKWKPILLQELKAHLETVPKKSTEHDVDHILRVWRTAEPIGKKLKADMETLIAAVFWHDLGRHFGEEVHGELSAKYAAPLLEKTGFPKEKREAVLNAIRYHEYFVPEAKRDTIEAKILCDADRIDAFGNMGIMRHIICYYIGKGKSVREIIEMIQKRWESVKLKESKATAKKTYLITLNYFKELEKEMEVQ